MGNYTLSDILGIAVTICYIIFLFCSIYILGGLYGLQVHAEIEYKTQDEDGPPCCPLGYLPTRTALTSFLKATDSTFMIALMNGSTILMVVVSSTLLEKLKSIFQMQIE